jgi:2-polyprenyl-3-methyl-5-hydroxy-6-metoxy-1,4-benzoquinol methylase
MTFLDRYLQKERIKRTKAFIKAGNKVLDIGSNYGELFEFYKQKNISVSGTGIDPNIADDSKHENFDLIKDYFPSSKLKDANFDVICMLAVLEHIPMEQIPAFAKSCVEKLKPGGLLIITVPSKWVDYILNVLLFFRLIKGMELEQHYGYDIKNTQPLFESNGFTLVRHGTFQLGLNNLFVFKRN